MKYFQRVKELIVFVIYYSIYFLCLGRKDVVKKRKKKRFFQKIKNELKWEIFGKNDCYKEGLFEEIGIIEKMKNLIVFIFVGGRMIDW